MPISTIIIPTSVHRVDRTTGATRKRTALLTWGCRSFGSRQSGAAAPAGEASMVCLVSQVGPHCAVRQDGARSKCGTLGPGMVGRCCKGVKAGRELCGGVRVPLLIYGSLFAGP